MILGIETSDDFVGVGIAEGDRALISRATRPEARNKNMVNRMISEVLELGGKSISEIDGVAVSIGPGSFTGLRVGLAAAKGLCWAKNIPLGAISSTEAIAESAGLLNGKYLAIKDARRNEFYYGSFECDGSVWRRQNPDSTAGKEELFDYISEGYVLIGNERLFENSGFPAGKTVDCDPERLAGVIALLGRKRIANGDTMETGKASPVYIRDPGIARTRR